MVSDPYDEARRIAQTLRSKGLTDWSSKIDDAIAGGATATEILMGLRWLMRELLQQGELSEDLRLQVNELTLALDALLR